MIHNASGGPAFHASIEDLHSDIAAGETLTYDEYRNNFEMSEDQVKLLYLSSPAERKSSGTIDHWRINQLLPLDNDKVKLRTGPGSKLNGFPLEIWMEILKIIDLKTLTLLRHVSKGFRNAINSLPEYTLLYSKVPYLIRAAIVTGVATCITISQLYQAYRSVRCSARNCHNDGEFIYLLRGERLCISHVAKVRLCSVDRRYQAFFKEAHPLLHNLPRLTTVVGERQWSGIYVDRASVLALQRKKVLPPWIQETLQSIIGTSSSRARKSCVRVPWYDPVAGKQDWGFYCKSNPEHSKVHVSVPGGYMQSDRAGIARSAETMLKHFDTCPASQIKWKRFCPGGER